MSQFIDDYVEALGIFKKGASSAEQLAQAFVEDVRVVLPAVVGLNRQSQSNSRHAELVSFAQLKQREIIGLAVIHNYLFDCRDDLTFFSGRSDLYELALIINFHEDIDKLTVFKAAKAVFNHIVTQGVPETFERGDELLKRLEGLVDIKEHIRSWKRLPPIALIPMATNTNGSPSTQSWFGGRPHLGGLNWPQNKTDGKPMRFVAQIDFQDLANITTNDLLPLSGALAFFVGIASPEAKVMYVSEPLGEFAPIPDGLAPRDGSEFPFLGFLDSVVILPRYPLTFLPLSVKEDATFDERQAAYQKLTKSSQNIKHQMFGLERQIQGGGFSPRHENHLLLQLTGETAGVANFWLPDDALTKKDFDQAFVTYDN